MQIKKAKVAFFNNLRLRAEEAMRQQLPELKVLSPEDTQQLIYELGVLHIELEMQNEELRQAQLQLEESRDRYADLYDFAPVGYFTISDKGLISEANLTGARLLGVDRSPLLKRPFSKFVAKNSQNRYYQYLKQIPKTETQLSFELEMVTQQGVSFEARLECSAYQDSEGVFSGHFRAAVLNITKRVRAETDLQASNRRLERTLAELRETQTQMVQQERMTAVGQLAAGIAHDFNNILTAVLGHAELIARTPEIPDSVQKNIGHISDAGERVAYLVRQILDFSRKSIRRPELLDLATLVQDTVAFFRRTIPENILISVETEPEDYLVNADLVQLQQVLTNLVVNARDAMPNGGELTIRLSRQVLGPDDPQPCDYAETPSVEWMVLSISDNGIGIPAEVLPHIFEPFFTTKNVGEGTGLGLAQVYGIIRQHQSCINVSSQEGQGTTFTIFLPGAIVKEKPIESALLEEIPLGSNETILLVEDEPAVLKVNQAMLVHLNYRVLTATNGETALDVYAEHKDEIVLVLTDIVMPKMDGTILLAKLRAQNPLIKVVMMTGYPVRRKKLKPLTESTNGWLYKPISIDQLAQVVHEALQ